MDGQDPVTASDVSTGRKLHRKMESCKSVRRINQAGTSKRCSRLASLFFRELQGSSTVKLP